MARGRGGFDVSIKKRAQSVPVGDFNEPSAYGKTQYISRAAVDDMDNVSSASKKQDQKLLDDITSRLCKFEFDCVKPGRQVASRTGFRRHLYGKKPLVERETREQRRKEELMYPWDYTFENIYRPREKRPWAKKKEKKEPPKRSKWDNIPEPEPVNHYPDQYPYKERMKRERKDPNAITLTGKRYENMGTHELLAKMKGKLEAKPRGRSAGVDVDILLEGLHAPLPRSYVKGQCFAALDNWEPSDEKIEGDPIINKKLQDSKKELADFENLLASRFKRRKDCFVSRAPPKPRPQTPPPQDDEETLAQIEREWGYDDDDLDGGFTTPITHVPSSRSYRTVHTYGPVSTAPASPAPVRSTRPYRSSSVCYGSPATPRSSRVADLENAITGTVPRWGRKYRYSLCPSVQASLCIPETSSYIVPSRWQTTTRVETKGIGYQKTLPGCSVQEQRRPHLLRLLGPDDN